MTKRTSSVFSIWANLPDAERDEVVRLINEFQRGDVKQRKQLQAAHSISMEALSETFVRASPSMNFGPLHGQPCPHCGRV
jgi:predicted Fe-S protein YdhL (DUF1289 family)